MLTKLSLENYRAFEKVSIPLAKVNLFFGPNNSGKSSLLSALNLLAQNAQSSYSDSEVMMSGKFEELGSYYDVVNGNDEKRNIIIGVEADLEIPIRSYKIGVHGRRLLKIEEQRRRGYYQVTIGYNKNRHQIRLLKTETILKDENITMRTTRNRLGRHVIESIEGLRDLSYKQLDENLAVRNLVTSIFSVRIPKHNSEAYLGMKHLQEYLRGLRENLRRVEFVGPFRVNPERFYLISGENFTNVGKYGERALDILTNDQKRTSKTRKNLLRDMTQWMKKAEIAGDVFTEPFADRYCEVIVKNFYTGEEENLPDVGLGCSQIIPILVAGFNLNSGGVLIVEEPEIHLHPKAQAELGSLLLTLYKRDIQLIVETHSEHLLLRLQSHVAKGNIDPEDINVFYVDPAGRNNRKEITRIPLGKDGYFEQKWPKGFFPERLQEAERLAGLGS